MITLFGLHSHTVQSTHMNFSERHVTSSSTVSSDSKGVEHGVSIVSEPGTAAAVECADNRQLAAALVKIGQLKRSIEERGRY